MAELKTKEGELTTADLAKFGIPPKQEPTDDPNLESQGERESIEAPNRDAN